VAESRSKFEQIRIDKLRKLEAAGVDPWGQRFPDRTPIAEIIPLSPDEKGVTTETRVRTAGRILALRDSGKVYFVVKPNKLVKSVSSAAGYADGAWHHMVATLSGQGMYLYLDGVQVGFSGDTKSGMAFGIQTGYWRMGGDSLLGLPGMPTSSYLSADVDEIAVYPVALTAAQVQTHDALGATGQ